MEQACLLLKGMWDDALIGLLHVMPKPHLWIVSLCQAVILVFISFSHVHTVFSLVKF